jgi:ABC-type nitrate/sulfonate/bicarbonate transport system permease component
LDLFGADEMNSRIQEMFSSLRSAIISFGLFLIIWQIASIGFNNFIFPGPIEVFFTLKDLFFTGIMVL